MFPISSKRFSTPLAIALGLLAGAPLSASPTLQWDVSPNTSPGKTAIMQMNGTAILEVGGKTFAYSVGGNMGPRGMDTDSIWYAPVDGTEIGPWVEADATLDGAGIVYHTRSTVSFNGRLYVVGGRYNAGDGFDQRYDGIRVFEPDATGNIPAENVTRYRGEGDGDSIPDVDPSLNTLEMVALIHPSSVHEGEAVLYVLGGAETTAVRSFRVNGETGAIIGAGPGGELAPALTVEESLPEGLGFSAGAIHGGFVYYLGGNPPSDKVFYSKILENDRLGPWETTTAPLPEARLDGAAISFRGSLYKIGGTAGTNEMTRNNVFRAEFGEDGDITGWINDTSLPVVPGIRRVGAMTNGEAVFLVGGRLTSTSFSSAVWVGTRID